MFDDRRKDKDRRKINLPVPSTLERRNRHRRNHKRFAGKPWWLQVDYASDSKQANDPHSERPSDDNLRSDQVNVSPIKASQ